MRRFAFRLQRLLDLKRATEREREIELAIATGKCVSIERRLAEIVAIKGTGAAVGRRFDAATQPAGDSRGGTVSRSLVSPEVAQRLPLEDLAAFDRYHARLDQETVQLRADLEQRRSELAEVTGRYRQAMRERAVLDKLRERREREYRRERNRIEQRETDEIAASLQQRPRREATASLESPTGDPYRGGESGSHSPPPGAVADAGTGA